MDSLVFALNAVLPIILIIGLGYLLKRIHIINDEFINAGSKVVFRVALPVLLFYNVYNISSIRNIRLDLALFAVIGIILAFIIGGVFVVLFFKDNAKRGVLLQCVIRSNYALIGIPLAISLFGDEGGALASIMSAFAIPLFNILAVIALTIFNKDSKKVSFSKILLGIVKNPLIIAVLLGLVFLGVREVLVESGVTFFRLTDIKFLYSILGTISKMATPLALLVLGGQFEFKAVKSLFKEIIFGVVTRTIVVPGLALTIAYLFFKNYAGAEFATLVAMFGSPVAVSSAIMAKEMGGDEELGNQLVVWTCLSSGFTLFIFITILKSLGIF